MNPHLGQSILSNCGVHLSAPGLILLIFSTITAGSFLFKNSVAGVVIFLRIWLVEKASLDFKRRLVQNFTKLSYDIFVQKNISYYHHMLSLESAVIFQNGLQNIVSAVAAFIMMIFFIIILFCIHVKLAFLIIGFFLFSAGVFYWLLKPKTLQWGKMLSEVVLDEQKKSLEFFGGFKEIVIRGTSQHFSRLASNLYQRSRFLNVCLHFSAHLPRLFLEALFMLAFVCLVWYVGMYKNNIDFLPSLLGLYLYVGFRFLPLLNLFLHHIQGAVESSPVLERVSDFTVFC